MNSKYREALPLLYEQVTFDLEEITAVDLFYTDGDSRIRQSFFKLVFPKAIVYIQEGSWWVSFGSLTDKESLAIHEWIDDRA
jgi:hypothetical protein